MNGWLRCFVKLFLRFMDQRHSHAGELLFPAPKCELHEVYRRIAPLGMALAKALQIPSSNPTPSCLEVEGLPGTRRGRSDAGAMHREAQSRPSSPRGHVLAGDLHHRHATARLAHPHEPPSL